MTIRELRKTDMPQLSKLYEQFWGEKSDITKMEQLFDEMEKESNYILLGAEEDGLIVGSVMGIVCKELYGECRPFLLVENMVTDANQRRKGVGMLLLTELEKGAKKYNCTQMLLVTEAERKAACGLYEKFGFQLNNKGYKKKVQ